MNLWFEIIDIFFMGFHTLLIIFNITGWMWRKTRKWNLITLLLTAGSWIILGFFFGWGYCPLTDWHFAVLRKMGQSGLPSSYIEFLVERLTGLNVETALINSLTLWGLVASLAVSGVLNIRDRLRKKNPKLNQVSRTK